MADAGFFKGTSAEQDSRFANKQKKLLKQMKFPDNIDVKIDILKVNLDVLKPWITKRLQELLGIEDDVVIEFVFNQLEDKNPDPKMMQINLTGFLGGSKARLFIGELWKLLSNAQSSPDGIPAELVEMKKKELIKQKEEDDRLREIRKREEDSHRQDIKPDIEKLDNKINGRNQSRNENGYKSRTYYDNDRRDRRRSPPKTRRPQDSPEPKTRHTDKKSTQSVSKSNENEDDRHHRQEKTKQKPKSSSNRHDRHHLPSKSPSHSRSPIKSSRKNEKHQQRSPSSSSTASNKSQQAIEKPKHRSSSSSSVDRSHKKTDDLPNNQIKKQSVSKIKSSPVKETVSSKSKKHKKQSKRIRSSSTSHSKSNSSVSSSRSSSSSEVESKKNKKQKKKPQPTKSRSSSRSRSPSINRNKKKDNHKSRKHSKSSSRKHHRSNDNKIKFHRDHLNKSKTKKPHRNESSKKKISNLSDSEILKTPSSPKKPRLESQIKVQTPPPPPPPSDVNKTELPIKPNRTERIVLLEESRSDRLSSISTRVSITTKTIYNEEHLSEDENEIDLRERLLREKAIKSMRRHQLTTTNNDINTKTTSDRIVYES